MLRMNAPGCLARVCVPVTPPNTPSVVFFYALGVNICIRLTTIRRRSLHIL